VAVVLGFCHLSDSFLSLSENKKEEKKSGGGHVVRGQRQVSQGRQGAFALVYLAERKSDSKSAAIKMMKRDKTSGIDWTALREIKLLQELKHRTWSSWWTCMRSKTLSAW
jgi:hypothetical protein